MNFSEKVAKVALDHYYNSQSLSSSSRGKPKEDTEWTVYAALVAASPSSNSSQNSNNNKDDDDDADDIDLWVVSCATGTKCTAFRTKGRVIHDAHAEILVRRGLMHALWQEVNLLVHLHRQNQNQAAAVSNDDNKDDESLFVSSLEQKRPCRLLETISDINDDNNNNPPHHDRPCFRLKKSVSLHLYISDSPCGDASIYSIVEDNDDCFSSSKIQFTGSKLVVSPATGIDPRLSPSSCGPPSDTHNSNTTTTTTVLQVLLKDDSSSSLSNCYLAREQGCAQLLGKLRSKSSRSNVSDAHRSQSMSCSDKIVRWQVLGWQGSLLAAFLPEPIRVSGLVVSRDPRAATAVPSVVPVAAALATTRTAIPEHQLPLPQVPLLDQESALQRALVERINVTMHVLKNDEPSSLSSSSSESPSYAQRLCQSSHVAAPLVSVVQATFARSKSQVLSEQRRPNNSNSNKSLKRKRDNDIRESSSNNNSNKCASLQNVSSSTNGQQKQDVKKISPCGFCIDWNSHCDYEESSSTALAASSTSIKISTSRSATEVLVGARGIRQGKKPQTDQQYEALQSRLCRASFVKLALQAGLLDSTTSTGGGCSSTTYREFKQKHAPTGYAHVRELLLERKGPLAGWLLNPQDDDFDL